MPATSLRPPDPEQQKNTLASHMDALQHIRGYCIAVEHIDLKQIANPPPPWFGTLSAHIASAKRTARIWTNSLEPQMVAELPQDIIEYGMRFDLVAKWILGVLGQSSNDPSAHQQATILHALHWLQRNTSAGSAHIRSLHGQFTDFENDTSTDYRNLDQGVDSIQSAIADDQQAIGHLRSQIAQLNAEIAHDAMAIDAAAIAGGAGIAVGTALLGLGAAAGPAAPFLLAVGGFFEIGAIAEAAAVIATFESRIAAARNSINRDMATLSLETQQIASLTGLQHHIQVLVEKNRGMSSSLSEIGDWWQTVQTKLDGVIGDLTDAAGAYQQNDWFEFMLDIQTAKDEWKQFKDFATNMQEMATGAQMHRVGAF